MKASTRSLLAAAGIYVGCGIVFGSLSAHAGSHTMALVWRWAAWVVSATAFGWQILFERRTLGSPARRAAVRSASASAIGACGLAGLAIYHSLSTGQRPPALLILSLVLWPAIVFVPAFFVAWIAARLISTQSS